MEGGGEREIKDGGTAELLGRKDYNACRRRTA